MINIKIRYKTILKALLISFIVFVFYTFFMMIKLDDHNQRIEKVFEEEALEGKPIEELVKRLGKPAKFEYTTPLTYDMKTYKPSVHIYDGYFRIIYYTDNPILNVIGWFPCGGTRVFASSKGNLTGVKEYCY